MNNTLTAMAQAVEETNSRNASLEEQVSDLALRLDTIGWVPADGWEDSGMGLEALKQTSRVLQDMVATSPLLKRASELRHGYVFGRGVNYGNLAPRHERMMEEPYNSDAIFSSMAQEELMKARLTDGNVFVLFRKRDQQFFRIPLNEITGVVTDPDDNGRVWFIQRTWPSYKEGTNTPTTKVEWYPVSKYAGPQRRTIAKKPVNNDYMMFFQAYNRQTGWTFGVPDGYAAITWTKAYSEYLKNNSKLVKAYAQIAYKVSTTKKTGNDAAAQMSMPGGAAGTATMGGSTDLVPMPRAGSDVSFENGRPLASMVAASLGVSVVALLSDPGAAGSSYGSAQTLDAPTVIVMASIQRSWVLFYREVFRNVKGPDVTVEFPSIENDQVYRQIQSLREAYLSGALHQDEYRAGVLDLLDVTPTKVSIPVPDKFNAGHLTPQEIAKNELTQAQTTSQANSTGGTGDQGETNNDNRTDTQTSGDNS